MTLITFSILCYKRMVKPFKALQYQLITEIVVLSIMWVIVFVTSGFMSEWFTEWGTFFRPCRFIGGTILCVPHSIYCSILMFKFDGQLKSGKIIKSFHCWKNQRFIILVVFIFLDSAGQILVLYYAIHKDDQGKSTYSEQTLYNQNWFIVNRISDCFCLMILIWLLWKMKFINTAIKELKNSDEFNGEYFEESVVKETKKQKEQKERMEEKKEKKKEKKVIQEILNEIAEKNLYEDLDFSCLKNVDKSICKIENLADAEVLSDREIVYQNMCQFMHPEDFLNQKKRQTQIPQPLKTFKSLSLDDFDSLDASQIDKTPKSSVYLFPKPNFQFAGVKDQNVENRSLSNNFSDVVQNLNTPKQQDVIESNQLDKAFPQKKQHNKIVKRLNNDIHKGDAVMQEKKQSKKKSRSKSKRNNKHVDKDKKESEIPKDLDFKKMDMTGQVNRKRK